MQTNLIERVLKTIRNYDMIKPGDTVLAAVSGGPDSVFLLHALARLQKKLGIAKIVVCNLDHGLRGAESREDSRFVKGLAGDLGLECAHKSIDLKVKRSGGLSTEEIAREARYKFFMDVARKNKATVIATGHTLDDQAETVLMRFIKGASLKGIVGISPVRIADDVRITRPLMELEKEEIVKFLDGAGIGYRIDRTNAEPIYFRNVVRSEIMPFLERYNPRLKRALFNLAEHLREDFEFIETEKVKLRAKMGAGKGGAVTIALKDIVVQPKALQKEILRDALEAAGGEVKKLSFRHWKDLERFIRHNRKGSLLDLPGDIRVSRTERDLEFRKR